MSHTLHVSRGPHPARFARLFRGLAPAALLLAASCSALKDAEKSLLAGDKPTAEIAGAHITGLSLDAATLQLDIKVTNPYAVSLPLASLDYAISSGGQSLLSGKGSPAAALAAHSAQTVPVTATIPFKTVLATLGGIKPGAVVPWEAAVDVSVNAPGLGPVKLPLHTSGQLPIPAVPKVSLSSVKWTDLSLTKAGATLSLDVLNTNSFAVDLGQLGFGLSLGGTKVAEAHAQSTGSVKQGQSMALQVPISFSPLQFGASLLGMLKGDSATYALDGALDVTTPFGPLHAPFTSTGKAPFAH